MATTTLVHAWALSDITIEADPDPEANSPLVYPVPAGAATEDDCTILARIRPDEDITIAIEAIARGHDASAAIVRGSVGSLIGARVADGHEVTDTPRRCWSSTKVLGLWTGGGRHGRVDPG